MWTAPSAMAPIPTFSSTTASTTASQPTREPVRSSPLGTPSYARAMWDAWILAAPVVSAASAALAAQVLPEAHPAVSAQPPVLALAPVFSQRQLVAAPAHRLVGGSAVPRDILSRQSYSAATASSTT